jgi:sterol 24-C-methyltransferase
MAPEALETEDHARDAAFNSALHGKTAGGKTRFMAMLRKDHNAQSAAVDEYFKHWDNKNAGDETAEIREVRAIPTSYPIHPT